MTSMIASAVTSTLAKTLGDLLKEEVSMLLGVKDELRHLNRTVLMIRGVLGDAERRAFTDPAVRAWLAELKDAVYDADDVIDLCRIRREKIARLALEEPSSSACCYSPFSSFVRRVAFRHEIGGRIRSINDRLARVNRDRSAFDLEPYSDRVVVGRISSLHRQTAPGLEPDIVGRGIENDTDDLVRRLLESEGGPAVAVVAIVGMGGIGKTTLAQKIFNHDAIKSNFQMPPPMWVCVSQVYSETNLLKEMIRGAGGQTGDAQSLAELEPMLIRLIEGKKFFLVLDDVWDAVVWTDRLRKPLLKGAAGSRVLVTTRDKHVARLKETMHVHEVKPLTTEESRSLLHRMVFQEGEEAGTELSDIEMKIADKCDGLPLAVKAIAGVLSTRERTGREWEKVLNNPAWSLAELPDGVMGALYLSYQDLPFPLKQCFVYCSLFPEDWELWRNELIGHWVAQGFVKEEGDMTMEEVAEDYHKDLLRRSLLQPHPRYFDNGVCTMHDLLRSLAQFQCRDDSFSGDVRGLDALVKACTSSSHALVKLRHLSLVDTELTTLPGIVTEQRSLRTFFLRDMPLIRELPHDIFDKLRRLRVLDLSGARFANVPESIGKLMHLRHLDLSRSSIEVLPTTIGSLGSLRYLILQQCEHLQSLPQDITKLYNMTSINLESTPVSGFPEGIGKLRHLHILRGFVTNENSGNCSLEEISSLSQLRTLSLYNLERALAGTRTGRFLLKDKRHLRRLVLYCTPIAADGQPFGGEETSKIQELFEAELFPPPSINILIVEGYFGLQFPHWMTTTRASGSPLVNLRYLFLKDCLSCTQLPPLGLLPNLNVLIIKGADAVQRIGPEFMGIGGGAAMQSISYDLFPKLEILHLKRMPSLAEWTWDAGRRVKVMPRLKELWLIDCPNLRTLPPGLVSDATSLTTVWIEGADALSTIENFRHVEALTVKENATLRKISNLCSLKELRVFECPLLEHVASIGSPRTLVLQDSAMESLPTWLEPPFPDAERVRITVSGTDVLRRCLDGGPDWPMIQRFPHVNIQVLSGPERVVYTKNPYVFNYNFDTDRGDDDAVAECIDANPQASNVANDSPDPRHQP